MPADEPRRQEPGLSPGVMAWVTSELGDCQVLGAYRAHSARTGVWRLRRGTDSVFLKLHKEKPKWHHEVWAYRQWAAAHGAHVPRLLAVYEAEDAQGIIISALEGTPLKDVTLDRPRTLNAYEVAGRIARRVHESQTGSWFGLTDCRGQPLQFAYHDAVSYMKADLDHWANLDKLETLGCLLPDEKALARWAHDHVEVYRDEAAIPINNDYSPKNWLVGDQGEFVGIIDLECMQWGLRVDSFAELWLKYFPGHPDLEDAFFAGYGSAPRQEKPDQAAGVQIKIGLANVIWGTEAGQPQAVERGRRLLRRVLSTSHLI